MSKHTILDMSFFAYKPVQYTESKFKFNDQLEKIE